MKKSIITKQRAAAIALAAVIAASPTAWLPVQAKEAEHNMIFADANRTEALPEHGSSRVIAVLDNGFYLRHEMLFPNEYVEERLDQRTLTRLISQTNAQKMKGYKNLAKYTYRNKKIPFAFDYADNDTNVFTSLDHGTAMASAAAGIEVNSFVGSGSAPAAQILAMKIFDDKGNIADTKAIVAALEDAYTLGADVICLSLGSPAGFSELGKYDAELENTIKELTEKGVFVVCSAGNAGVLGAGSIYDEYYSYDYPLASIPDAGTVSTPSTVEQALSVANADTFSGRFPAFKLGEEYVPYSDSNNSSYKLGRQAFNVKYDGKTLEYVPIGGIGADADYAELVSRHGSRPLSGKLALIKRGELTFVEKINIAEKYGAEGVIIYDNTSEKSSLRVNMGLDGTNIYAILVSEADGERLLNAEVKEISVSSRDIYVTNAGVLPEIAPSSGSGPTPTLKIKPEISAPGEGVRLAAANGGYTTESGTSVSTAHIAGVVAELLDYVPEELSGGERIKYLKNLLMTTAVPIVDGDGKYIRVTRQGAGLVNAENAANAELLITHDGASKIELGNNIADSFDITLTLENLTNAPIRATLSAVLGIPEHTEVKYSELCNEKDAFYKEKGQFLSEFLGRSQGDSEYFAKDTIAAFENARISLGEAQINKNAPEFEGAELELAAGEVREITLEVDLSGCSVSSEIFENGCLLEGFVFAKAEREYSIPLLGSLGDFYSQDPFVLSYESTPVIGGGHLYSHIDTPIFSGEYFIGTNNIQNRKSATARLDERLCAVSPALQDVDGMIFLSLSLLGNITDFKAEILNSAGEPVAPPIERDVLYKAYSDSGSVPVKYDFWLWSCRSEQNEKYIYPDGEYICKISGYNAAGNYFTQEIPLTLDTKKPQVTNAEIYFDGTTRKLKFSVTDDHYIQAVIISDESMKEMLVGAEAFAVGSTSDAGTLHSFDIDISELTGSYIYITVYDMAFNSLIYRTRF